MSTLEWSIFLTEKTSLNIQSSTILIGKNHENLLVRDNHGQTQAKTNTWGLYHKTNYERNLRFP